MFVKYDSFVSNADAVSQPCLHSIVRYEIEMVGPKTLGFKFKMSWNGPSCNLLPVLWDK